MAESQVGRERSWEGAGLTDGWLEGTYAGVSEPGLGLASSLACCVCR